MKYKAAGLALALLMIVCAVAASAVERGAGPNRVHQHLSTRQPDAGCSCDGSELCTHLPLVIIDTAGAEIPGMPLGHEENGTTSYSTTADGETMLSVRISILDDDSRKLDKSLVDNMDTERGRIILEGLIETGHQLGLTVLAEGVENDQQVKALRQLHCDVFQGFRFAFPIPAAEAKQKLLDRH